MFGATAAVDDGNADPGDRGWSHKLERLQPPPEATPRSHPPKPPPELSVQRGDDVGYQIVGVLDAG
jgi:hypothetical protein